MPNNEDNFVTVNQQSVPSGLENANAKDILDYLFANNNRLLTGYTGELALPKDTQNLIAYFSGGEIIISRAHRYDGRVLSFIDLLHHNKRNIKEPFYSDLGLISNIYKTNDERFYYDDLGFKALETKFVRGYSMIFIVPIIIAILVYVLQKVL